MSEELLYRLENRVAVLTLNRPERLNALTRDMMQALLARLSACADDDAVGCVVLTGAGGAFCSGGDVRAQAKVAAEGSAETPEQRTDQLRASMEASRLLHEMPKPTIAMVNGVAAGAGMSLALACDLRIAGRSARMTTAFAKVGLSGDYGGTWFLTQLVGTAKARELYYLSEVLDAARIEALGLANRVVDGRGAGRRDDGVGGEAGERAERGAALYEAEPERGGDRDAGGGPGQRGVRHAAVARERGPQGGGAGVRGKACAGVPWALTDRGVENTTDW